MAAPRADCSSSDAQEKTVAPFVSCIMPTSDRRVFVPGAIACFLSQRYRARELIIVDDGADSIDDLVPDDPSIRYVRMPAGRSLGAKRNIACETARGAVIAHWDDDDWSAPDRLTRQIAVLQSGLVDVCGLRDLLYHDLPTDRAWLYCHPQRAQPWVAGGTMLYWRASWRRRPFPDVGLGEDSSFLRSSRRRIAAANHVGLYIARIHGRNTSSPRADGPSWTEVPVDLIRALTEHGRQRSASRST
jgi:glycosyltransferase involved in cell wall biosynthesis